MPFEEFCLKVANRISAKTVYDKVTMSYDVVGQANGKLQIHFMDVGQCDGAILMSPLEQMVLFDNDKRGNCDLPVSYLQQLGANSKAMTNFLSVRCSRFELIVRVALAGPVFAPFGPSDLAGSELRRRDALVRYKD